MKTLLPTDEVFRNGDRELREDFEMAKMMLKFSVEKNIGGFSLSGLTIPAILHDRQMGSQLPEIAEHALEMCVFQEHFYDRIVSQADNIRLQQEIWRFNERTRKFREFELRNPFAANEIADLVVQLMNALFAHEVERALELIDSSFDRRMALFDEMSKTMVGDSAH